MGKFLDFIIDYDEDPETMGIQILQNITVNRLEAHKPCILFLSGDSGEGKSYAGLKILDIVNKYYDIDTLETLDDSVMYLPTEYLTKLDNCLFWKDNKRPDLKNLRVLMIDEAREVVKARLWQSFLNQAIADCSAMSRSVKEIVLIVVSQFIKDIDSAVRYTLNFYAECQRPLTGSTQLKLERVWKNTYDLERPRLCKRPLVGYLDHGNRRSKFYPQFEVHMPPKEIYKRYDHNTFQAKSRILRKKIEETLKRLNKEIGHEFDKVQDLVTYYVDHPEQIKVIRDPKYKKFRLRKNFRDIHDITHIEAVEFEKQLLEKLAEKGMIRKEEDDQDGS